MSSEAANRWLPDREYEELTINLQRIFIGSASSIVTTPETTCPPKNTGIALCGSAKLIEKIRIFSIMWNQHPGKARLTR